MGRSKSANGPIFSVPIFPPKNRIHVIVYAGETTEGRNKEEEFSGWRIYHLGFTGLSSVFLNTE